MRKIRNGGGGVLPPPPPPREAPVRSPCQEHDPADAHAGAHKSVLESANPRMDLVHRDAPGQRHGATAPSPGRPTSGVVKQDKSSGGPSGHMRRGERQRGALPLISPPPHCTLILLRCPPSLHPSQTGRGGGGGFQSSHAKPPPPPPCMTFRRVAVSLRGPGLPPRRCVGGAAFSRPLRPVCLVVLFPCSRGPVVGALGVVLVVAGVVLRFLLPTAPRRSGRPPHASPRFRGHEAPVPPPPPPGRVLSRPPAPPASPTSPCAQRPPPPQCDASGAWQGTHPMRAALLLGICFRSSRTTCP